MISIVSTQLSRELYDRYFSHQLVSFPPSFEKKLLDYRRWQDSQASLFGRLLLRYSLRKYHSHELDFSRIRLNEYGKPSIQGLNVSFNISHSSTLVCCATSVTGLIGIDLEEINNQIDIKEFDFQFTINEAVKIYESTDKIREFYRYWTQKEAVIKLVGKGLSIPLKSFEIIDNETVLEQKTIYTKEIFLGESFICHIASEMNLKNEDLKIENVPNSILK